MGCVRIVGNIWMVHRSKWSWQGDPMAPDLFAAQMIEIMEPKVQCVIVGGLYRPRFANNGLLLAEMADVLLLSLRVMIRDAKPFGLESIWNRTLVNHIERLHAVSWKLWKSLLALAVGNQAVLSEPSEQKIKRWIALCKSCLVFPKKKPGFYNWAEY